MKKDRIVATILTLILFACLIGVEGQYTAPRTDVLGQATPYQTEAIGQPMQYPATAGGYQTATATTTTPTAVSQYSQYYTMGPAPNTHVTAPQQVDLTGKIPTTVYFGYQQHGVPLSQYQSDPAFTGSNTLWIQGPSSWIQYAAVPWGQAYRY